MPEQQGVVTLQGQPMTLMGQMIKVGDRAPDVTVLDNDLRPVKLSAYRGKVVILTSVPSLDTAVCDLETRRFNQEAARLGDEIVILTVSMDLPFAQKRWCGNAGVDKVKTLSDYREAAFGNSYGLLIKELRLLARSVLVLDREGIVRYKEVVWETTHEPNYEAALKAARDLL